MIHWPQIPNEHALGVLILTLIALYFFRREDVPLETSSLAVIGVLAAAFSIFPFIKDGEMLSPSAFFSGFGHEALITVCALMVIGQGIVRTGALEPFGSLLARLWRRWPMFSVGVMLVVSAGLSAFVNNTPIVVLMLPMLITICLKTGASASKMLMPMGFATLVGGMTTTIGTSTNLLVVSVAKDLGGPQLGLFDFAPVALVGATIAIVYLWFVAPRLLPDKDLSLGDQSPRLFAAYLNVPEDSPSVGKTLSELIKKTEGRMRVEFLQRGSDQALMPLPDTRVQAGDRLMVKDTPDRLKEFEKVLGAALFSGSQKVDEDHPLRADRQMLAEVVIIQGSGLIGRTLHQANFAQRFGVSTIALHRGGAPMDIGRRSIGRVPLQVGDILLVQGSPEQVELLKKRRGLLVLDGAASLPQSRKAPMALAILAAVVGLAAAGWLPISVSALLGVLAMLLSGCLNWQESADALSTQVILIVASSLALGSALVFTGGVQYLAEVFLWGAQSLPPGGIVAALMLLLALLTNVVSNNAAAVIGTPIALSVADQLALPAEPFILAVMFGANLSYATPMAYKTNLLVMNAGSYRFADFVRVGVPLILLMWVTLSWLLTQMYLA
jgi:di/tricarboxylate transporter